jgi:Na+-driven multidrug efflux pump
LTYIALGYVFFAFGMVVVQAFNGAGDTRTPTLLNIIGFWLIQIPLAYFLAITFDLGPKGVFIAIVIAESVLATMSVLVFRRGKWKLQKV